MFLHCVNNIEHNIKLHHVNNIEHNIKQNIYIGKEVIFLFQKLVQKVV